MYVCVCEVKYTHMCVCEVKVHTQTNMHLYTCIQFKTSCTHNSVSLDEPMITIHCTLQYARILSMTIFIAFAPMSSNQKAKSHYSVWAIIYGSGLVYARGQVLQGERRRDAPSSAAAFFRFFFACLLCLCVCVF